MNFKAVAAAEIDLRGLRFAERAARPSIGGAIEYMPLSQRLAQPDAYLDLRARRRQELEELLLCEITEASRRRIIDIIYAVCEESSWSASPCDDISKPTIDRFAADTACLLGWAAARAELGVREISKITLEARARVFSPIMARDDYACLSGKFEYADALAALIAGVIMIETEKTRLHALLRRIAPRLDIACDSRRGASILRTASVGATVFALNEFCRQAANVDLMFSDDWIDEILISNIAPGAYCDPFGEGLARALNGSDIFAMGYVAQDSALKALGAQEYARSQRRASGLITRMLFDLSKEMALEVRAPRLKYAAVSDCALMTASGGGARAVMCALGRDAGGFSVCVGDTPVILSAEGSGIIINGCAQTGAPGAGECDFDEARCDMIADITRCYADVARARSCQRTLMLDRESGFIRNVNIIETHAPGRAELRFFTPFPPVRIENGVRAGVAAITWDIFGEPEISRAARGDGYIVSLKFNIVPGSNIFGLNIERI